jgi:hypothetical protein
MLARPSLAHPTTHPLRPPRGAPPPFHSFRHPLARHLLPNPNPDPPLPPAGGEASQTETSQGGASPELQQRTGGTGGAAGAAPPGRTPTAELTRASNLPGALGVGSQTGGWAGAGGWVNVSNLTCI